MATTTTLRPDIAGLTEVPASPVITDLDLARFLAGRAADERLVDLLAFALAAEGRLPATPETMDALRAQAARALTDQAFRTLHNAVEQIRREAVTEHLGRFRRPPGFPTLLSANLLALVIAGLAAYWLAQHPATLAGLAGLLSG